MLKEIYRKIESKFPYVKILKDIYSRMPGRGMPRRYGYLIKAVRESKAKKVMEIGTWRGHHALEMIEEAKKHHPVNEIEYYGFDLFELLDSQTGKKEFSAPPLSLADIKNKLEKTGANLYLYRGYTKDTLPDNIDKLPQMDFIYIDGGHSVETIQNDWDYAKRLMGQNTIVIFDDYWNKEDAGCKRIIEQINRDNFIVEILPVQDKFKKDWGVLTINFVKVKRK